MKSLLLMLTDIRERKELNVKIEYLKRLIAIRRNLETNDSLMRVSEYERVL